MMGNLLEMALSVIGRQNFDYYEFSQRVLNANKIYITEYKVPISLSGSVQPVSRNLYAKNGLDFDKNYFTFFVSKDIVDVRRDVSGDQFFYCRKIYQCESITDWYSYDGWTEVLCIEVNDVG